LAEQLKTTVSAHVGCDPRRGPGVIFVCSKPSDVPIAGDVWLRRCPDSLYQAIDARFAAPSHTDFFCLPICRDKLGEFLDATCLDIRVVPSARIALDYGFTEYFNGTLEWADVPFKEGGKRVPVDSVAVPPSVILPGTGDGRQP